ncbi:MAG: hypothetical protein RIR18_229 [Pseudomonadota bacterium]|jgi:membrane-bound lytic murein transglycosylase D
MWHSLFLFRILALLLLGLGCAVSTCAAESDAHSTVGVGVSGVNGLSVSSVTFGQALIPEEIPLFLSVPSAIDLTVNSDEIWGRIRNGFAMPDLSDELVLTHQQWYLNRPDYLRRMLERSRPYLHHIVSELERRGMPTELALLPMVESSYDPNAYSPARAAGLWQFIPSTGKNYNLGQTWWEDERRDVVASTTAALDYLQTIYDMHGDWHLALASYNWGENAVARAIAKNVANGLPTDFSSLTMPNETRHYVPKLQALKNIFGNPSLFDRLNLPAIPNRPFFKQVSTPAPIDVRLAAKLAGMSLKEFLVLNPSHNRPVIKDKTLLLPTDKAERFEENLNRYQAPLQTWETYTLKRGDKLEKLLPRLGLPLSEIKRINSLPEKSRGFPGQILLLPGPLNRETADSLKDWRTPLYPNAESKKEAPKGKSQGKSQPVSGKGKTAQPRGVIAKPSKESVKKSPSQQHSVLPSKKAAVKAMVAKR